MVLNKRIADSSLLAKPRFKIKQSLLMEPASGVIPLARNNKNAGKRWKLIGGGVATCSTTSITAAAAAAAATPGTIINAADAAATVSSNSGMTVPSVTSAQQPTTHQKVRRILEEHAIWQERANKNNHQARIRPRGYSLSHSSKKLSSNAPPLLVNYNIVASRGELSRGSFIAVRDTSPFTGRTAINKGRIDCPAETNDIFLNAREDSRSRIKHSPPSNWEKRAAESRDNEILRNSRNFEKSAATFPKSSSVPANLKSVSGGLDAAGSSLVDRFGSKNSANGILGKSSAFLASLTHSRVKNFKLRSNNKRGNNVVDAIGNEKPRFCSLLRRRRPLVTNKIDDDADDDDDDDGLRGSPSCQNLTSTGKKKNIRSHLRGVKKSVSFSSDTSFEEQSSGRGPFRKTAVHEAKVYRKGVLRDINATENKGPETWELPFGDPKALLKASREIDDHDLRYLVSRIRRSGLGGMDVNATDSSGRTAISYMAGNGSPAMLEAALSFTGSDPNLPDNEGNTPLHFAAQAGQTECLNIILQRCSGIQVDARNILGFTPLMKAALQGRTKCAKILLFAGANPAMRDYGRGLRAEQWARYCGRHVCADVIERFARHRLIEKNISCRWGSEPELATKVLQGKIIPVPAHPLPTPSTGFRSKIKRVFRTTSGPDRTSFSLVSQLTNAALCASTPALPKSAQVSSTVKSLVRPLSVPQLRITLAGSQEKIERTTDKHGSSFTDKIETSITKPPRSKKKNK